MKPVTHEYQVRCDNCGEFAMRVVNHAEHSVTTACSYCDYWMVRNLLTAGVIESLTNFGVIQNVRSNSSHFHESKEIDTTALSQAA